MTGIIVVEDHEIVVDGWRAGLAQDGDLVVEAVASSLAQAQSVIARSLAFDIAIVDVRLGDGSGFDLLRAVDLERTKVILVSAYLSAAYLVSAQLLGARGYLLKGGRMRSLIAGVRDVAEGGTAWDAAALRHRREHPWRPLTLRERDVVAGLVEGRPSKDIAHALGISTKTVESHLTDLYVRHGVFTGRADPTRRPRGLARRTRDVNERLPTPPCGLPGLVSLGPAS